MALMQMYRVDVVPDAIKPGVCYVTKNSDNTTVDLHFTNKDGSNVYKLNGDDALVNTITMAATLGELDDAPIGSLGFYDSILYMITSSGPVALNKSAMQWSADPQW